MFGLRSCRRFSTAVNGALHTANGNGKIQEFLGAKSDILGSLYKISLGGVGLAVVGMGTYLALKKETDQLGGKLNLERVEEVKPKLMLEIRVPEK